MLATKIKKSNTIFPFVTKVQLNWEENDERVTVLPEDEDQFYITVQHAIQACQAFNYSAKFSKQFDLLLERLARWIRDHNEEICNAFLTIRDAGLLFLINRNSIPYNRDFEDALTDLDIEIAQDSNFDTIKLSILALPKSDEDTIISFLNPEVSICYNYA